MAKHCAWIGSLFVLTLLTSVPTAAQSRPAYPIAYISVQRIMTEAADVKAATHELEMFRVTRARELESKKQAVDATRLQLVNVGGVFRRSSRARLAETLKRQEADLQQATLKAQADFAERQKQLNERLRGELNTIVVALAKQRGVAYVLNQDTAVVLAPAAANWTDEVLQQLNAGAPRENPKAPIVAR
jgi:Skp family chaperone for outer membrane proteins